MPLTPHIFDSFIKELPADPTIENTRRLVNNACFSFVKPKKTSNPKMLHVSTAVGQLIGITKEELHSDEYLQVLTGNAIFPNTHPYAMCYGGHQFGQWAGQLGDGRAINLFEVFKNNSLYAIQLKGAGATPYSRNADGLAVLRSSIREYLCSEAMHHLGVPTTRALSLALSGDQVMRDLFYDGNPDYENGAIVSRVAPSFIRFGSFEIHAAHGDTATLKKLTDYTIKHYYPTIVEPNKEGYIQFFKEVTYKTLDMIIHWQRVGFVHGVMNTDNMSILGLTIDYGPYGWLDDYDHEWTPNTTDRQNKRYKYGNQANIGLWNLLKLANALYPLIEEAAPLEAILNQYKIDYDIQYLEMMCSKLGLINKMPSDQDLVTELEANLHLTATDMTLFFRLLSAFKKDKKYNSSIEMIAVINDAFYTPEVIKGSVLKSWGTWFNKYYKRLQKETLTDLERKNKMNRINPKYVLRNYMAQLAIESADKGDYSVIDELYQLLINPYKEQPQADKWFTKRPNWAKNKAGCSMLSCSS